MIHASRTLEAAALVFILGACAPTEPRGEKAGGGPIVATPEGSESAAQEAFRKLLASMGVQLFAREGRLEIAGWVNMQKGLIEVFACAPDGKTHESLIVLDCVPSGVHAGLLALGLKPGTPVETGTEADYKPPTGEPVRVEVVWKSENGEEHRERAEDLVWNQGTKAPMPRVNWLFTGSFMQSVTGDPKDEAYAADFVKSIITTYHDPSSVLENPLPEGRDDTLFFVNEDRVPSVGSPVKVVLTKGSYLSESR